MRPIEGFADRQVAQFTLHTLHNLADFCNRDLSTLRIFFAGPPPPGHFPSLLSMPLSAMTSNRMWPTGRVFDRHQETVANLLESRYEQVQRAARHLFSKLHISSLEAETIPAFSGQLAPPTRFYAIDMSMARRPGAAAALSAVAPGLAAQVSQQCFPNETGGLSWHGRRC